MRIRSGGKIAGPVNASACAPTAEAALEPFGSRTVTAPAPNAAAAAAPAPAPRNLRRLSVCSLSTCFTFPLRRSYEHGFLAHGAGEATCRCGRDLRRPDFLLGTKRR